MSNTRLKFAKNQAKANQHPESELLLSSFKLSSITCMRYSKKCAKSKCSCFNEIMWLIVMKMRLKMKNRSHRYDINRARPRLGHKYTKYKMRLSIMIVMCNNLCNIWCWIHVKVKQHWRWVEKKSFLYKKQ